MKSNSFLRLIIFSLCLFSALPARAEAITETEARVWTQDKGQRLLNAFAETDLKKRYAELDTMFLNFVDLDYISKFVLGKYWRRLNEKEKTDYQQLFKRYALSVYKSFPLEFDTSQIEYTITGVRPGKNYADVTANIFFQLGSKPEDKQNILVEFRLNKTGGKLRIIDLKIGESSLILSYRGRFYEMIAQDDEDLGWFMEDLQTITESTEKQNQLKVDEQQQM